jgi:chloramphenicol O-acetyltransferase
MGVKSKNKELEQRLIDNIKSYPKLKFTSLKEAKQMNYDYSLPIIQLTKEQLKQIMV